MNYALKKIWAWFTGSHHWQHLLLGVAVGMLADGWYTAALVGTGVAGALEFKDRAYGKGWSWTDFALTIAGVTGGYALHAFCLS